MDSIFSMIYFSIILLYVKELSKTQIPFDPVKQSLIFQTPVQQQILYLCF